MEVEVRIMKITNNQMTKQTWGVSQVSFIYFGYDLWLNSAV
jgi:hypothetical protein